MLDCDAAFTARVLVRDFLLASRDSSSTRCTGNNTRVCVGTCFVSNQATWSDAYFDEGGANRPIITYSVPIRQDGVFIGVATMDVALDPSSTLGMSQPAAFEEPVDSQAGVHALHVCSGLCVRACVHVASRGRRSFLLVALSSSSPSISSIATVVRRFCRLFSAATALRCCCKTYACACW